MGRGIKHFQAKKRNKPYRFLKSNIQYTLSNPKFNIWKETSIGPLLDILRISLRGIKHFQAKKRNKPYRFLKSNIPSLTQNSINGKRPQLDPYWIYYVSPM